MENNLGFNTNAMTILRKRYLWPGEDGAAMLRRVARCAASAEDEKVRQAWEDEFYYIMADLFFLPNTPALINSGKEDGQVFACFVLPIDDDMASIYDTLKYTALIHKSGGGTGFSFSKLRPKNSKVKSTNGVASGPISFMKVFNASTDIIKQGGARRGANMAVLRIDHPDIMEFITCKEADGDLTNFNISVAITDEFMQALKEGKAFRLKDPHTGELHNQVMAKTIWDKICERAWKNGDPGVLFIDQINRLHPVKQLGSIESTNPCGEQPLLPGESCVLGSINLAAMVAIRDNVGDKCLTKTRTIEWGRIKQVVFTAVRFLDNLIDVNKFPLPFIEGNTKRTRKIGLGVMGFADMLAKLRVPYDSDHAIGLAKEVMAFINETAKAASIALGNERGVYPAAIGELTDIKVRNATRTTIAPTGSISTIAGCWGGIEPYFSLVYEKKVMDGTTLSEVNPYLVEMLKEDYPNEDFMRGIVTFLKNGTALSETNVNESIKAIFKTSGEIDPMRHLEMQAAFQEHTDNAVSKTINLPNSATVEDISKIYKRAYELGLKGVTVYRDGCKSEQVYYSPKKADASAARLSSETPNINSLPREVSSETNKEKQKTPDIAVGTRIRKKTGCGQLYVHINRNSEGAPIEIFADLGKAGGCPSAFTEGLGRLASLALKHGASLAEIRDELVEIKCSRDCGLGPNYIGSCLDGTAKAIHDCLQTQESSNGKTVLGRDDAGHDKRAQGVPAGVTTGTTNVQSGACPSCGGSLDFVEGCRGGKCRSVSCDYYTCG